MKHKLLHTVGLCSGGKSSIGATPPANPFQNRPARSGRSMSKLPSVGVAVCRRMSEFDHSTMSFTCRPSGAEPGTYLHLAAYLPSFYVLLARRN
jgi:hypothetical protein